MTPQGPWEAPDNSCLLIYYKRKKNINQVKGKEEIFVFLNFSILMSIVKYCIVSRNAL